MDDEDSGEESERAESKANDDERQASARRGEDPQSEQYGDEVKETAPRTGTMTDDEETKDGSNPGTAIPETTVIATALQQLKSLVARMQPGATVPDATSMMVDRSTAGAVDETELGVDTASVATTLQQLIPELANELVAQDEPNPTTWQ
ncbi:hypothetical protein PI124_g21991 [Phytophthora idaei]|nr:hypothetical protein PI125_g23434 [Phytophthora idaei]KAG3127578.1 hypothetical protein PI126_g21793 [Phytophthora idaei]KAG3232931.1 hypothetical protein PI124_g21991 [Phytophthora idaei]